MVTKQQVLYVLKQPANVFAIDPGIFDQWTNEMANQITALDDWIPVKERLPDEVVDTGRSASMLVLAGRFDVTHICYCDLITEDWYDEKNHELITGVTCWKPLPT